MSRFIYDMVESSHLFLYIFLFQLYLYLLYYAMILGVGLFVICSYRQDEHQNLQDSRPTQNLSYL